MPVPSDTVASSLITAVQRDLGVWVRRAVSAVAWRRCHLLCHWPLSDAKIRAVSPAVAAPRPPGVLDDAGQNAWRPGLRLAYGFSHGPVLPVRRRMGSRPRQAHSRPGGAAVLSGMGDRGRATRDVIGDAAVMESGCTPDAVRARPTPVRQVDGEARCLCVPFGVLPKPGRRRRPDARSRRPRSWR